MAANNSNVADEVLITEGGDTFEDGNQDNHSQGHHLHHFGIPDIPSPAPTRRNRTSSAAERGAAAPIKHGKIKVFCREKGHGFIVPNDGTEDVFVHVSDVEGETVPKPGDDVIYKTIKMPPKMEKIQAVHVQIVALKPGVKHEHWENTSIQ